jgi:hypothetical protein
MRKSHADDDDDDLYTEQEIMDDASKLARKIVRVLEGYEGRKALAALALVLEHIWRQA